MEYIPGLNGVPAAESKLCFIDGNKGVLEYRGYAIETLAEHSTFEETAYLLIKGRLPNKDELSRFKDDLRHHRRLKFKIVDVLKLLPEHGHPMDATGATVAAMGMFYPAKNVEDPEQRYKSTIRLIAKLPTLVAAFARIRKGDEPITPRDDLDHAANFLYMLSDRVPDATASRILDVCMILHAEHAMNASTFSARITGSTLAGPYGVISAAISALAGPLHGGASEAALLLLRQLSSPDRARMWAEENMRNQQIIPGFGHRVYKVKDPRATILQRLATQLVEKTGRSAVYDTAIELERVVTHALGAKGVFPNVDFFNGVIYDRLGIPVDLFSSMFAMSRVVGWLAHWNEQVAKNHLLRPTQIYQGDREKKWVPIADRL
ncbi:MAG: citrate synthase [Deltaproteobacteria bacterium]|nr:citrate synthase [Deltaproteobacteria bacterium]